MMLSLFKDKPIKRKIEVTYIQLLTSTYLNDDSIITDAMCTNKKTDAKTKMVLLFHTSNSHLPTGDCRLPVK